MSKKHIISQVATLNGVPTYASVTLYADEADIPALTAIMEGKVTVFQEISTSGSDANVASYDLLTRVSGKAQDTIAGYGSLFPTNRGLIIKNGKSPDELTAIFENMNFIPDYPAKKPAVGSVKVTTKNGSRA